MNKTVGLTIDTKSTKSKNKVYYYKTDKTFKPGQSLKIKVKSGGTPHATVIEPNSSVNKMYKLKELECINE